jgi:hypothetical protein
LYFCADAASTKDESQVIFVEEEPTRRLRARQAQQTMRTKPDPPIWIPPSLVKAYREGNINAVGEYLIWTGDIPLKMKPLLSLFWKVV